MFKGTVIDVQEQIVKGPVNVPLWVMALQDKCAGLDYGFTG